MDELTPEEIEKNNETLQSDLVKNAITSAVTDAVTKATEGLETNKNAILEEKRTLSEQVKTLQESAKQYDGLDIEKIRTMIDATNASDEARLISEGKIDEVISTRTASVKAGYETQFLEKDATISELKTNVSNLQNLYESKLIGDAIRVEGNKQGMLPEAIDDAIANSKGIFTIGDKGEIQATKVDEFINSPERFIKELKTSKPFYWPASADFRLNGSDGTDLKDLNTRVGEAADSKDFEAYKKLRNKNKK